MRKKNKRVARASLFAMMVEMWSDVHSGKVEINKINLTNYARKYHVGKFKRSLIDPYLSQDTCPSYEQACCLRRDISEYINNRPEPQPEHKEAKQLDIKFNVIDRKQYISECIDMLKKEGYVLYKKV